MSTTNVSEGTTEQSREQVTPGSQAPVQEQIANDGSHSPTNDLTTEQLFELIRKQQEQIDVMKKSLYAGTEIKTSADQAVTIPTDKVKADGKSYQWTMGQFVLPERGKITAEQAATDKEIIAEILAIKGQGILKELV